MHDEEGHIGREGGGGGQKCHRGGLHHNMEGARAGVHCVGVARRALLRGAAVRLATNDTPLPASAPYRRSGRFTNRRVGAVGLHFEDIKTCDPTPHHDGSNVSVFDIPSFPAEV